MTLNSKVEAKRYGKTEIVNIVGTAAEKLFLRKYIVDCISSITGDIFVTQHM